MTYSWDPWAEPFRSYLGRRAVLDEQLAGTRGAASQICSGISGQTRDILGSMDSLGASLGADIGAMTDSLGGDIWAVARSLSADMGAMANSLASGMDEVRRSIDSGLGHVAGVLDAGFAGLLGKSDEIKLELQRLVELVELEEQRKAMENFRYGVFALDRGLWDEALEYVTAAIEGDAHSKGYKLDWHFHWVRGELLLGNPARHDWPKLDPGDAEQAFLLAARYARADVPEEAARALLMASVAAHAQSREDPTKLEDLRRHAEAAHALDPGLTEAAFQVAKAHMALGDPQSALPALRKAIDRDTGFAARAAEDPDHRRHEGDLNGFFDALRAEKRREVAERARAACEPFKPFAGKSEEFAAHQAVRRLRDAASGPPAGWGLVDLLAYEAAGLAADVAIATIAQRGIERRQATRRVERRMETARWQEQVEIDEPYEVEETYREDVVVKPGGWFRRPVVETVERTRRVTRIRKVARTVERSRDEEQWVVLDRFGDVVRSCRAGTMVEIPPGLFLMGGGEEAVAHRHPVKITRPFLLGVAPVTQREYEAVTGKNPSDFKGADHPVEGVSWLDAVRFCNTLSREAGYEECYVILWQDVQVDDHVFQVEEVRWKGLCCPGYRLPTEAEWEYACRAGAEGERYGPVDDIAWHRDNSENTTHPVGQKAPNAWGLYDLLGNVSEWCWDMHQESWDPQGRRWRRRAHYPDGIASDPTGPSVGNDRISRGDQACASLGVASRNWLYYTNNRRDLGFRLARSLAP